MMEQDNRPDHRTPHPEAPEAGGVPHAHMGLLWPQEPAARYACLRERFAALSAEERDPVANLANGAALLYSALPALNWAGFYLRHGDELTLGPFQGRPACLRIPLGKGVCGGAAAAGKPLRVPDVTAFPGHIACDDASRSELVAPLMAGGRTVAVLDLDSPLLNRFDQADEDALTAFAAQVAAACDWGPDPADPAAELPTAFLRENIMGPNPVTLLRELLRLAPVGPGSRVMDLGCGRAVTSLALARWTGAQVFATDLWIAPEDNLVRIRQQGLEGRVIPVYADANAMPYAKGYFDAIISVDAYHYFGFQPGFLDEKIAPYVAPGGLIALCVPGLKRDFDGPVPPEMLLSWTEEDLRTIRSTAAWTALLSDSRQAELLQVTELPGFDACWADWLACDNPYAQGDRASMDAGAGRWMNLLGLVLRKR